MLEAWVEDDRRRPLLIRGARQVGKTYAVTALGERRFADVASINLEREPRYRRCFDTLEPGAILDQIGVLRGKPVEPGRTLLFIDEVQECPAAVMALRYCYEHMPELHVVTSHENLEWIVTVKWSTCGYRISVTASLACSAVTTAACSAAAAMRAPRAMLFARRSAPPED